MSETDQKGTIPFESIDVLIEMLKKNKNYKEVIKQGYNNYNISQYKINKIRLEEIPELVNLIELNYINIEKNTDQSQDKRKYTWLANQLKLFVWIAICHSFLSNKSLQKYEKDDWTQFTHILTRKTNTDLDFQIKSIFKNFHGNKEKWEEEEEEMLKEIIQDEQNKNKWNEISRLLYFKSNKKYYRSSQRCREYWFNHLDPNLNKNRWSIDEDLRLVKELQTYGFKWSKLTQVIQSTWGYRRTEHMVKNRTKFLCKKYSFNDDKEQGCMKELAKLEKKLIEEKLKPQSATQIKDQESGNSKEQESIKSEAKKKQKKRVKNLKGKEKQETKQETSQIKLQEVNLDSQSSEEDFEDERPQKKASKSQELTKKRNVIILFHAKSQPEEQQRIQNELEAEMVQEGEDSPEMMIGQHVEERLECQEMREQNANEESVFEDEYNIVEVVEDNVNIDLNEEMQFEHHTHGGTMRERVTHELAKFFAAPESSAQAI